MMYDETLISLLTTEPLPTDPSARQGLAAALEEQLIAAQHRAADYDEGQRVDPADHERTLQNLWDCRIALARLIVAGGVRVWCRSAQALR